MTVVNLHLLYRISTHASKNISKCTKRIIGKYIPRASCSVMVKFRPAHRMSPTGWRACEIYICSWTIRRENAQNTVSGHLIKKIMTHNHDVISMKFTSEKVSVVTAIVQMK